MRYRIRAEDTFDLRYLTENKGLRQLQQVVDRIVNDHPQLTQKYPYRRFAGQAVPGEMPVRRQIYEVLKRQKAAEVLDVGKLIFFEKEKSSGSGFRVRFLSEYLEEFAPFVFEEGTTGKAVGLCFRMRRDSMTIDHLLEEPVPEIRVVDCPDDQTCDRSCWNQIKSAWRGH